MEQIADGLDLNVARKTSNGATYFSYFISKPFDAQTLVVKDNILAPSDFIRS